MWYNLKFKNTGYNIYRYIDQNIILLEKLNLFSYDDKPYIKYLFLNEHFEIIKQWFRQLKMVNSLSNHIVITSYGDIQFQNIDICKFLYLCERYSENISLGYKEIDIFIGGTKVFYYPSNEDMTIIDSYIQGDVKCCEINEFIELFDCFEQPEQHEDTKKYIDSAFQYLIVLGTITNAFSHKFYIDADTNNNKLIFLVSERYNSITYDAFIELAKKWSNDGIARVINKDVQFLTFFSEGIECSTNNVGVNNRDIASISLTPKKGNAG